MISTVALSIANGIIANLGYDALFNNEDLITDKVYSAYERAKNKFYLKYGNKYGSDLNSFLERQSNIDAIVNSLFYGKKNITYKNIDLRSFDGYNDGTKDVVIDFIIMLYDEMHADYTLDKIITEKKFMIESKKDRDEIKRGIVKNNRTIESLKEYFTNALNKSFTLLMEKIPFDIALSNQSLNIASTELPLEIKNGIERKDTVSAIIEDVVNITWYHLRGGIGSGKTQLLILLSKKYKGKKIWINVKGLNPNQTITTINSSLAFQTNTRANNDIYSWYERALSKLNSGDVIMIDDLPNLTLDDTLADLLMKIAIKCKKKGIKLFTSSSHDINLKVKQSLDNNMFKSKMIPPFNEKEIEELLYIKGAPNNKTFRLCPWISVISKNNPSIVNLIADYLSMENWNVNQDVFEKINNGLYMDEFITEIQNTLITNIKDSDAKQLLYRLTAVNGQFTSRYVQEIARVEPKIDYPFEKITELLGYWVIKKDQNYSVTPLISKIGELNLDKDTKCKVHSIIAKLIAKKKVLDPLDVIKLINHLMSAKEFNQAGYVFLRALQEMNNQEIEVDYWGLTSIWKSTVLPTEMDYDLQIKIRIIQIMVLSKFETNDIDFIIEELESLLLNNKISRDENITTKSIACFSLAMHFIKSDRKKSLRFMKQALTTCDHELLGLSELDISPEEVIWFPAPLLSDKDEVYDWIDMVSHLSQKQIEKALKSELCNECCLFLTNRIWFNEYQKTEEERDWEVVFKQFEAIEYLAKKMEIEILEICIIRSKLIVYGEHLDKLDKGKSLAKNFLLDNVITDEGTFLIKSMLGKQFLLKKQYTLATPLLREALKININSFPFERVDALIDLSLCEGYYNNKAKASDSLSKALKIANEVDYITDVQKAKILGEYAVSLWEEGSIRKAYFPLQQAAELLFQEENIDRSWKCLASILGHVTGYYSNIASNGIPPRLISNGDVYHKPTRGVFQTENDELEEIFDFRKMIHLMTLLYLYAEAIEEYSEAKKWIFKGYGKIRSHGIQNNIVSVHLLRLSSYLILEEKLEEAIEVSIKAHNLVYASMKQGQTGLDKMLNNIETDNIFIQDPNAKDKMYMKGIYTSVVPIVLYICNIYMTDSTKARSLIQCVIDTISKYKKDNKYVELWNGIEEALLMLLDPNENLYERMRNFENIDDSFKSIVQGIFYIIASIDSPSNQALDLHSKSILWVEHSFDNDKFGTKMILNPFYKNFWIQRYIQDRFSFQNTEVIDKKLKQVLEKNSISISREILQVMSLGF